MHRLLQRVVPYLKATSPEASTPEVDLPAEQQPVLEPFAGNLVVSYALEDDTELRFVREAEMLAAGATRATLRRAALVNLTAKVSVLKVRLAPHGHVLAVLCGGVWEATLMLCDEVWPHVTAIIGADVVAVAPARDVLAVSAPAHVGELRDVVTRAWPACDHLLTQEVFERVNGVWGIHRAD